MKKDYIERRKCGRIKSHEYGGIEDSFQDYKEQKSKGLDGVNVEP